MVHIYQEKYMEYDGNVWEWHVSSDSTDSYLEHRGRRSRSNDNPLAKDNVDVWPDFTSLEKDAENFGLRNYNFIDTFGIHWIGEKGCVVTKGSIDYKGSLYYYDYDMEKYAISDTYSSWENEPSNNIFEKGCDVRKGFVWYDIKNIKSIKYTYCLTNHLFKDACFEICYGDETDSTWEIDELDRSTSHFKTELITHHISDIVTIVNGIKRLRPDLLDDIMNDIDKHFNELKDHPEEEYRYFYPGCDARTFFNVKNR